MTELLTIESLAYGSAGVAHTASGKTIFVEGGAPGDVIIANITEDKKTFARATIDQIVEPGTSRVSPPCPYAQTCGGCSWQHVHYEDQLRAKRTNVISQLTRIGGYEHARAENLVANCQPSKRTFGYRNKLEFACERDERGNLSLGFRRASSNQLESIDRCPLGVRSIERIPKALRGALRYLAGSASFDPHHPHDAPFGLFRVGVRSSLRTGATEIALWTRPGAFPRAAAVRALQSACKATSIVRVLAQPGRERTIKGVEVLSGRGNWNETLGEFTYTISAPSFFQVNTAQAERLIDLVMEGLKLSDSARVADLYSGAGTFTLPLAAQVEDVIAVESAGSSVRDLRRNADEAGLWVDVVGGDAARELPLLGHIDALVVDPPRSGLASGVAESIALANPLRVAYVSCDPATWARDVKRLESCGYLLEKVTPVDLFPQTYHCEVVSIFVKKDA